MSKSVLISIRPKWCDMIANGKKTIEVRKTRPKIETPFKCYIYCTLKGSKEYFHEIAENLGVYESQTKWNRERWYDRKGKVIGEFVCDMIFTVDCDSYAPFCKETGDYIDKLCCLDRHALWEYTNGRCAYGWHISDLVIYDTPKELSELHLPCTPACNFSEECGGTNATDCLFGITRPPQSWCYVEGTDE